MDKPSERVDLTKNAIYEVLTEENIVKHYGEELAEVKRRWCLNNCVLDDKTDEPLPPWVVSVLCLNEISFKSRVKILIRHGEKIERAIRNKVANGVDLPGLSKSQLKEAKEHIND